MKNIAVTWAVLSVTTALVAAGCTSSNEPESGKTTPPNEASSITRIKDKGVTARGGTVHVLNSANFESLDPVANYHVEDTEVGRLFSRTLTFIKDTPGEELSIQPDLAESLGTSSDGGKTWTYKLRAGLKYEDGRPITAADIKYGVERSYALDMYDTGTSYATYMVDLLANENDYAGPYGTPEKDLASVETPDDRTVVFHFKGPQPDADWILSLLYTSPVPKDADTKADYRKRPLASGPYKIEKYTDDSLVLVRNAQWDPATDPNRPAYPDRFEFERSPDAASADARLLASDGKDPFAVALSSTLVPADLPKLDEPSVKARFINGPGLCVDYVAMNTEKIKDPDVRHAIALAIDRQGIQKALGGDLFGSITDSIVPSTVKGFVAPDLGLKPQGDPEAAMKLLAGKSVPALHFALEESFKVYREVAKVIQSNLKAAGLDLAIDVYPQDKYDALFAGDDVPEIDYTGWCLDWPTPSSVVPAVLGPDPDGQTFGSNNASRYFDPAISKEIQALASSTEPASVVATKMAELANQVQTTAWPLLPTTLNNSPQLVGANITNAGVSPLLGVFDLNTAAVKK
jgi:peptide/nickel transport system substrate-binding protein